MAEDQRGTDVELFASSLVFAQQIMLQVEEFLEPFGLTSRQSLLIRGFEGVTRGPGRRRVDNCAER